ncbi:MAG TPA: hypothetical protein VMM60_12520 [Ilumatobacter sp.]|nr:hypothetical protein [Ilumatobacter sp.]
MQNNSATNSNSTANSITASADTAVATASSTHNGFLRTRWAAVGAAIAVSVGAGGFGLAQATVDSGPMPVYIAMEPCRLLDTRPEFQVGDRGTPLGADETVTVVGTGPQGSCDVPVGVNSLAMNVTALDATAPTFLRFAPGNSVPAGEGSSLNPVPGQPPTPNAVTTLIDAEGEFAMYNLAGSVDVVIDIVGYYDDHVHTGDDIVNGSLTRVDLADEPGVAYATTPNLNAIAGVDLITSVDLHAPSNGHVVVTANAVIDFTSGAIDQISCFITDGSDHLSTELQTIVTEPASAYAQSLSITRSCPVSAAGEVTYQLFCQSFSGTAAASQAHITATYLPTWYGDIGLGPIGPIGPIEVSP